MLNYEYLIALLRNYLKNSWVKRSFILLAGMSLTVGIYSDIGNNKMSAMTNEFFEKAAQQKDKNNVQKTLRKAERLFEKAVRSYNGGNRQKANEYYCRALASLAQIDLDLVMQHSLNEDYQNIFSKLNKSLNTPEAAPIESQGVKNYTIPIDKDNELVKKYMEIYSTGEGKERVRKALERSGKYREMILSVLHEYNLPEELQYLPIVESLFNNNTLSSAGALGIWQIMPKRARALNLKVNYWVDERKDPEKATRAAAQYLKDLYLMFDDWHLALQAYNRGEFGLSRDLAYAKATNIYQVSDRKAVPKETENFVPQFMVAAFIGDNYKEYGFGDMEFEKPMVYDEVIVNNVIDLKIVAQCTSTTLEKIKELNPSLMAWCTPHNYDNFKLKLPAGTRDEFVEKIAKVTDLNPSGGFVKYKVQKGDCLSKIAKRFFTSISILKTDNNIRKETKLRENQVLVVRPGKKFFEKKNT
ncbi:MAG: transglycosylase SLT domain-containing protein [Elusimicrobia bacterium]|nr:transglycosylase SLT domain-containing protein [Candidatus Liberimonas magnetica]